MKFLDFHIDVLAKNREVFRSMTENVSEEFAKWKMEDKSWSMLEVLCHLYDEEREDFRRRLQFVLDEEEGQPPAINPPLWVSERKYMEQDFNEKCQAFFSERQRSLDYLRGLKEPELNKFYVHPQLGKLDGYHFLSNWVAHDFLHQRQIVRLKYDYLADQSPHSLAYAGTWK